MIEEMMTALLTAAVAQRASDIYVLPVVTGYHISLRSVTGVTLWRAVAPGIGRQLLTYVKFHANMAVSEQRRPQVGALTWSVADTPLELRFSTVGDYAGQESLVMRLIYSYHTRDLDYLIPEQRTQLLRVARRRGLMVFAGPTGAGKTTTMYTVASHLATTAVVLTIEDPVEIKEPRFIQLQVNPQAGMDYDALIKVGLRHRPDVFVVGEIRDAATAQAAVRAALSGHLVLSTLHAQTALGTLQRLRDLGVPGEQLRQVLTAACYQRVLPRASQGMAVLLDVVTGAELWQPTRATQERWMRQLEQAQLNGQITAATYQAYRYG